MSGSSEAHRAYCMAPALASAALLAITLSGCGEDSAGKTVLRAANWAGAQVDPNFMSLERKFREDFDAAHPGIHTRPEPIPGYGQYAPKLMMMHITGSVPDAIQLDASSAAVFIRNGVLRDLTPFIENDPDFKLDDYFENVADIFRFEGGLYAIPLDFTPMVMFYNKRLFDKAGVPYPKDGWTWPEFLDAAQRLTIPGPTPTSPFEQYGMYFENNMPFWVLWLWAGGGDVLDPAGRKATGYFDGAPSVEAIEFLMDLMHRYRVVPTKRAAAIAGGDLFRVGKAAMDIKGHWMMIDYTASGLDVGVVTVPVKPGVAPSTVIYASGMAISAKAEQPELAWEFIKHLTSYDVQVRRVKSGLAISGNRRAAEHYAGTPTEDAFIAQVGLARPPWGATVERYPYLEDLGRELMDDLLLSEGAASVEAATTAAAERMDAALGD